MSTWLIARMAEHSQGLAQLKGLGPMSEAELNKIGIYTEDQLRSEGAVNAYIRLGKMSGVRPSLNLLYAMVGALENKHWTDIAKADRQRLLFELEDYKEMQLLFAENDLT